MLAKAFDDVVRNQEAFILTQPLSRAADKFACSRQGKSNRKPQHVPTGTHSPVLAGTGHSQSQNRPLT